MRLRSSDFCRLARIPVTVMPLRLAASWGLDWPAGVVPAAFAD